MAKRTNLTPRTLEQAARWAAALEAEKADRKRTRRPFSLAGVARERLDRWADEVLGRPTSDGSDPRPDLIFSDFMDAATLIGCSYEVVDRRTDTLTGWDRGVTHTFICFMGAGLRPTREQAADILHKLWVLAQDRANAHPDEGDPSEEITEAIEAVRRGEKP